MFGESVGFLLLVIFANRSYSLQCSCFAQGTGAILETYKAYYINDRRYCDISGYCKSFAGTGCVRLTGKLANLNGSVGFCNALQSQIVEFAKSLNIPSLLSCEDFRDGICYCDRLDNCNKPFPSNQSPTQLPLLSVLISLLLCLSLVHIK